MVQDREGGMASMLGLALLLLVILLGMGLWQLVRGGLQDSNEALMEIRLRLCAQSVLEKAAVRIEAAPGVPGTGVAPLELPEEVGGKPPLIYEETCNSEGEEPIEVQVFLVRLTTESSEGLAPGQLPPRQAVLEAWAALPKDKWGWQRRKVWRGLLVRPAAGEGEVVNYVWKGWLPAQL